MTELAEVLALVIVCTKCGLAKPRPDFYQRPNGRIDGACRSCLRVRRRDYAKEQPETIRKARQAWYDKSGTENIRARRVQQPIAFMLRAARQRADAKGIPFAITETDIAIPEFCPVLGMRLQMSAGLATAASPSLDRIVPSLGYVPGNVCVISNRANRLKSDGTVEEHEAILRWLRQRKAER